MEELQKKFDAITYTAMNLLVKLTNNGETEKFRITSQLFVRYWGKINNEKDIKSFKQRLSDLEDFIEVMLGEDNLQKTVPTLKNESETPQRCPGYGMLGKNPPSGYE